MKEWRMGAGCEAALVSLLLEVCNFLMQKEMSRENPELTPNQQTGFTIVQKRRGTSCALRRMFESSSSFA